MKKENKLLYLKISVVLFSENSRDERELIAVSKAGWREICILAPKGQEGLYHSNEKRHYEEIDLRPLGNCRLAKPIGKIIAFYRYIRKARKLKPDAISGHDLLGLLIGYLSTIGVKKKPELIYDAHEYEMGRFTDNRRGLLKSKLIFVTEKFLIKKTSLTITVNESIYEQMKADYNLDFPAVVVRNVPVLRAANKNLSFRIRKTWQERMDLELNEKIYIYHGMISPGRGIEEAIEAVSSTECGGLVIMGYCNDEYKRRLELIIANSQCPRRIIIIDAVSGANLIDYLGAADIGVIIIKPITKSYYFALPNKLFESIHAGNAVIASDLPEIKNVVKKYGIGVLCNPYDVDEIKTKWIELSKQNINKLYKKNIEIAQCTLNWQVESEILVNAMVSLLNEKYKN